MYEELVKRLRARAKREDDYYEHGGDVINEAADAIEELQKQVLEWQKSRNLERSLCAALEQQIPRWIPVTERLPEDGQDILAVQSWDGEARIVPANYDRGLWYDCVFDYPAEHITHWMPLPEPPKEET